MRGRERERERGRERESEREGGREREREGGERERVRERERGREREGVKWLQWVKRFITINTFLLNQSLIIKYSKFHTLQRQLTNRAL